MIYLRPLPPRDGEDFFSDVFLSGFDAVLFAAAARLSATDFNVLVDFFAGLSFCVGAPCGLDVSLAAAWFRALVGFFVLTPPGMRDAKLLEAMRDAAVFPPDELVLAACLILSAAVLP